MSDVTIYGESKTLAKNPWVGTGFEKKGSYIRNPVPWDSREQGVKGLSPEQKKATEEFTSASKSASQECEKTGNMSTNICRVKAIRDKLKGKNY